MSSSDSRSCGGHIIVLGNEKGGSGKSTTAMHLIVGLLEQKRRVAAIDLDFRQRSLARYLENRARAIGENALDLAMPTHETVARSDIGRVDAAQADERTRFEALLSRLTADHDIVVIDCPGSDTYLARLAHSHADTILTPLNDSFVDLDLLAHVDPEGREIISPSVYSEMVWEARKRRAAIDGRRIDWIVMRNRVSAVRARNQQRVAGVLERLAKRIGFRFTPGLSERVIYRELFLKGLTLGDLKAAGRTGAMGPLTMSQVAARQELRRLIESLRLRSAAPLEMAG